MKALCYSAIVFVSAAAVPADPLPEPLIDRETLSEYASQDLSQWKLLRWAYVEALGFQMNHLAEEIARSLESSPEASLAFRENHLAFLRWAGTQAEYSETVQWFDLTTGENSHGSGYGFAELSVLATLYWERILYYRDVLASTSEGGFTDFVFKVLPDSSIGGF